MMRCVARGWNLFLIGRNRKSGSEDQLTEMLVWLANGVPDVAAALERLAFGDRSSGSETFELTTQHVIPGGRLDALMLSSQVALVVESKLESGYAAAQIRRYLEWLDSEFADWRPRRGLLTLTAREAPWDEEDIAFAKRKKIKDAARRWADLHELLEPLTHAADGGLAPQLVREFLEMLAEEGLVPVEPLRESEFGTAWADSYRVIGRYREFFDACREQIGLAVGAEPIGRFRYEWGDACWQDYQFKDGARLAVGLWGGDEKTPGSERGPEPVMYLEAKLDHPENWMETLEKSPPEGWTTGERWWGGERPQVWRLLRPLLSAPTFEQQREAIASAAASGRSWIDTALK